MIPFFNTHLAFTYEARSNGLAIILGEIPHLLSKTLPGILRSHRRQGHIKSMKERETPVIVQRNKIRLSSFRSAAPSSGEK